ncbi:SDR family oxidoreductase [Leifsonia shinshuensis]
MNTSPPSSLRVRLAGLLLVLAGLQYLALEAVAAAAWPRPGYDYAVNFISDLGNPVIGDVYEGRTIDSPLNAAMDVAFVAQGVLFIAAALLFLPALRRGALRTSLLTLAIVHGVGVILVGFFHESSAALGNGVIVVHSIGAAATIVAGNTIAIVVAAAGGRWALPRWYRTAALAFGVLGLAAFAALLLIHPLYVTAGGVPERIAVYTIIAWEVTTGVRILLSPSRAAQVPATTSTPGHAASALSGRRALVTGGTHGIGRAVAEALAREGATVVVTGRNTEEGEATVAAIGPSSARFVAADLSGGDAAVGELARAATAAAGGTIDILVNNAAVLVPAQSFADVDEDQVDQAFAVNLKAPILLAKALVPGMIRAGGGAVVNVGSVNGSIGMAAAALYGSTKAGLHSLTSSWAAELASQGVRVNAVAPGPTMTDWNASFHDRLRELSSTTPDRRPGTAAEVAAAVVFLVGPQSSHINGVVLPIDGGLASTR